MIMHTHQKYLFDTLSFEQAGNMAWEIGENSLIHWTNLFNQFAHEHSHDIAKALDDFSILYGVSKPTRQIVVDLHHNPVKNNTNGGPKSNLIDFKGRFPVIDEMGDIMYRLPYFNNPSAKFISNETKHFLHEIEHAFFQNETFNQMVHDTIREPEVAKGIEQIFTEVGFPARIYANEPLELITTYLETVIVFTENGSKAHTKAPLLFRTGKNLQTALIEIETVLDSESPNGPNANVVNAWKEILKKRLDMSLSSERSSGEAPVLENAVTNMLPPSNKYSDIYQLGKSLDANLVQDYLRAKKQIDSDFVKRLIELAQKQVLT